MYNPTLGDYVMAIVGLSQFSVDESWPILKVYEAFHRMTDESPILKEAYFSTKGGHHYSKQLEELFFQMGTAKLLEVRNPEYGCYLINTTSKNSIRDYLKRRMPEEEFSKATALADLFRQKITEAMTSENESVCAV